MRHAHRASRLLVLPLLLSLAGCSWMLTPATGGRSVSPEQKALVTITTARGMYKDAVVAVNEASATRTVSEDRLDRARVVLRMMKPVLVSAGVALEAYLTASSPSANDEVELATFAAQIDALVGQLAAVTADWRGHRHGRKES